MGYERSTMGATVFDAARVSTVKTASGEMAYLWEEKTHCAKDETRKDARWEAMAFGRRDDILKRIYLLASSIPGGMLRVGGKSPTAFAKAMINLMDDCPHQLLSKTVRAENAQEGFYAAITDENREAVRALLKSLNRPDLEKMVEVPQLVAIAALI